MDPAIANKDFRPPPQPRLPRGLLAAIVMVHLLLVAALVWDMQWKRGASREIAAAPHEQIAAGSTTLPTASSPRPAQEQAPSAQEQAAPASTEPAGTVAQTGAASMGAGPASPPAPKERQSAAQRRRQDAAQVAAAGKRARPRNSVAAPAAQRTASPTPSFDCAKARSFAERTICSDAELAQLDRALGRLYARAKQAAPDPAAFRRQSDAEWRRREKTCRDRSCLLRWYADRRQQLTQSLNQASAQTGRTATRRPAQRPAVSTSSST